MSKQSQGIWRTWLSASVLSLGLMACQSIDTTQSGAVGVSRHQSMLVSARDMDTTASKQYQQVLQEAGKKNALDRNPAQVARVQRVAKRLIAQTGVFRPDALSWRWEVHVLISDELNAWCMPGGKIAFYSGLIEKLSMTDDEIAAVMGHEISHALREHARERASQQMVTNIGVSILASAAGLGQAGADLGNTLAKVTFELPNSRLHETEADRMGVELAARAGYDPHAAIGLWKKMSAASEGQPPQWLSTHPSHESRIRDLTEYADRVTPLYEATRVRRG